MLKFPFSAGFNKLKVLLTLHLKMCLSKQEVLNRIKSIVCEEYASDRLQSPFTAMPQAAVLIPLIWNSQTSEIELLLTKRSQKVSNDKGHVCFPGGMREASDRDEVENALRESDEEIGLKPEEVQVLGTCVPFLSGRKILMRTVLGLVKEDFEAKPNEEVEFAFRLPVRRFLSPEGHHCTEYNHSITDEGRHIHFFQDTVLDAQHVQTFGITAQILIELAVAIYRKQPDFETFQNDIYSDHTPFQYQRKLLDEIVRLEQKRGGKL